MAAALDYLKQRLLKSEKGDSAGHQQGEAAGENEHKVQQVHIHPFPLTVLRHASGQVHQANDLRGQVASDHGPVGDGVQTLQGPPALHPAAVIRILTEVDGPKTCHELHRHGPLGKGRERVPAEIQGLQSQAAPEPGETGQRISGQIQSPQIPKPREVQLREARTEAHIPERQDL